MTAILQITDGTTTINLLDENGVCLSEWDQNVLNYKGGGTFRDSPLADGRRLVDAHYANIFDTFDIKIKGMSQNSAIEKWQELGRLLTKAANYWLTTWQNEPVWIKAQATAETNPRYTLIQNWNIPSLSNPFSQPFLQPSCTALFDGVSLVIEHGPWLADIPGESTCVQTSGLQEGWAYDAEWNVNFNTSGGINDIIETQTGRLIAGGFADFFWYSDNGTAWNNSGFTVNFDCYTIAQDTTTGDILAAGTSTGAPADREIWRSQDNGSNWSLRIRGIGRNTLNGLIYRPSDGYFYVSTSDLLTPRNAIDRSNDGGGSWNQVFKEGQPGTAPQALFLSSDDVIYASTEFPIQILRSTNGTTWSKISQPVSDVIFVFAEDSDYIYAGTENGYIFRSANGIDWGLVSQIVSDEINDLLVSNSTLYAVTDDSGVFFSQDQGLSWKKMGTTTFTDAATIIKRSASDLLYLAEATSSDIFTYDIEANTVNAGRSATCDNEVFFANKQNISQLTNIWNFDASGPTYTANFPRTVPFAILPDPMANGDIAYFGINQSITDTGPFNNLILDISQVAAGTYTLTWEYSDGGAGWPTLTTQDGTNIFGKTGVNSVNWVPPSDWAAEAVNGVTALWVRARISGVSGNPQGPTQQNRDIYTVTWPRIDIDELQVAGDIPAIMQLKVENQSDKDGPSGSAPDAWTNRVITGLRSLERGETFTAFLNCADEQNPIGVTAADGANTSDANDIEAPSGRKMQHTSTGASTWTDECTFTLSTGIARDFYGEYHAYVRAQQASGTSGQVRVRLQVKTGTGGVTFTTDHEIFPGTTDWALLDFGKIEIPASDILNSATELPDETQIIIQVWSSAGAITVNLYDLVLMPTDEWAGDFVDKALETDSGIDNGYLLDVDSVSFPKQNIRSLVRIADATGLVRSIYQPITPGPAILQANRDQRLWFLAARYSSGSWYSEPWLVHSIQIFNNERYLSMRGSR